MTAWPRKCYRNGGWVGIRGCGKGRVEKRGEKRWQREKRLNQMLDLEFMLSKNKRV